ncbi:MAG: 4-hydroxy-3-methylbut-2-enyl diphosphate reductase IspH [Oceanicaulis sp. HLUCCA04]|nr:MAG: 4-hydroxy-3-methylbut-2-enyl diphosphate reductase IspH [Oceanicaulis sp. HLUCCA04]
MREGNAVAPLPLRKTVSTLPTLHILTAAPRGFCAGVDRAIQIVEKALERYGAPVYVRHEIVHNKHVVNRLKAMGAVFVKELDECPDDRPVVFSAHGVPKRVPETAARRNMLFVDATCPLVSKVHVEAGRHHRNGLEIVLIGHAGHPEVIGTMGQLPEGAIHLIETVDDAKAFTPRDPQKLAYVTQTTLSVDDTAAIVEALQARFPAMAAPHKEDICYATTNRQEAVKAIAPRADMVLVVGAPNSSNSVRLVEVAKRAGASDARLVQSASELDMNWLHGVNTLGLSAGASAPEELVEDLLAKLAGHYTLTIEEVRVASEDVVFKLPKEVA